MFTLNFANAKRKTHSTAATMYVSRHVGSYLATATLVINGHSVNDVLHLYYT